MTDNKHILVVEDDEATRAMLAATLHKADYIVAEAGDGSEMRSRLADSVPDLVLLDINLPDEDGFTLAKEMRSQYPEVGVIIVSMRGAESDKVTGLDVGADDYIPKPFSPSELLARVNSLVRRLETMKSGDPDHDLEFHGWSLDLIRRALFDPRGEEVQLTRGELDLLAALVANSNEPLHREYLLDVVNGGTPGTTDRTIDTLINRLRKKIEEDPKHPRMIITCRGVGYKFVV